MSRPTLRLPGLLVLCVVLGAGCLLLRLSRENQAGLGSGGSEPRSVDADRVHSEREPESTDGSGVTTGAAPHSGAERGEPQGAGAPRRAPNEERVSNGPARLERAGGSGSSASDAPGSESAAPDSDASAKSSRGGSQDGGPAPPPRLSGSGKAATRVRPRAVDLLLRVPREELSERKWKWFEDRSWYPYDTWRQPARDRRRNALRSTRRSRAQETAGTWTAKRRPGEATTCEFSTGSADDERSGPVIDGAALAGDVVAGEAPVAGAMVIAVQAGWAVVERDVEIDAEDPRLGGVVPRGRGPAGAISTRTAGDGTFLIDGLERGGVYDVHAWTADDARSDVVRVEVSGDRVVRLAVVPQGALRIDMSEIDPDELELGIHPLSVLVDGCFILDASIDGDSVFIPRVRPGRRSVIVTKCVGIHDEMIDVRSGAEARMRPRLTHSTLGARVVTPAGEPIAKATVLVRRDHRLPAETSAGELALWFGTSVDTSASGRFEMPVPSGRCLVRIAAPGFEVYARVLELGATAPTEFVLRPAQSDVVQARLVGPGWPRWTYHSISTQPALGPDDNGYLAIHAPSMKETDTGAGGVRTVRAQSLALPAGDAVAVVEDGSVLTRVVRFRSAGGGGNVVTIDLAAPVLGVRCSDAERRPVHCDAFYGMREGGADAGPEVWIGDTRFDGFVWGQGWGEDPRIVRAVSLDQRLAGIVTVEDATRDAEGVIAVELTESGRMEVRSVEARERMACIEWRRARDTFWVRSDIDARGIATITLPAGEYDCRAGGEGGSGRSKRCVVQAGALTRIDVDIE